MTVTGFAFGDGSTNTVQTTLSATCPTVAAGDTLVVVASVNGTTPTLSVSGGGTGVTWSSVSLGNPDVDGLGIVSNLWIATATASSTGSTISISSNTAGRLEGAGCAVTGFTATGAVTSNPTQQTTASSSVPFPSVTLPGAGYQLLGLCVMRVASTTRVTLTAPSGSTNVAQAESNYTTSAQFTDAIVATNSTVGSGSQSPGTGTASTTVTDCTMYTVGLAPSSVSASVQVPSAAVGSRSDAATPSVAPDVPTASAGTGSDAASFTGSSSPPVPSAALGAGSDQTQPGTAVAVPSAGVATGSDAAAIVSSSAPPIPSAGASVGSDPAGISSSSTLAVPSAAVGMRGGPAQPLDLARFSWWDGTRWWPITPLVWDGSTWRSDIAVAIVPSSG